MLGGSGECNLLPLWCGNYHDSLFPACPIYGGVIVGDENASGGFPVKVISANAHICITVEEKNVWWQAGVGVRRDLCMHSVYKIAPGGLQCAPMAYSWCVCRRTEFLCDQHQVRAWKICEVSQIAQKLEVFLGCRRLVYVFRLKRIKGFLVVVGYESTVVVVHTDIN